MTKAGAELQLPLIQMPSTELLCLCDANGTNVMRGNSAVSSICRQRVTQQLCCRSGEMLESQMKDKLLKKPKEG